MSRVTLLQNLYMPKKSALAFDYDKLGAPRIYDILTPMDVQQLIKIATSLKYNGDIEKKYELIDEVMTARGFKRAHAGTNRVVYNFLELPTFVAKVAVDKIGMKDTPAEFKNQKWFKPFCCKIFEVDPSGVIGFVERVNPISSLEEFLSISDDIFNMMITKIIGKYVVDDLGSENYMNFGIRCDAMGYTFGPVILDYPYAYELDGNKLICAKPIQMPDGKIVPCGGGIDYDAGFNHLYCTKCGRKYKAMDLKNDDCTVILYDKTKGDLLKMRARVVDEFGNVILDSGRSTDRYITREEYDAINTSNGERIQEVDVTYHDRRFSKRTMKKVQQKNYMKHLIREQTPVDEEPFNPVIKRDIKKTIVDNTTSSDKIEEEVYDASDVTVLGPAYGIQVIDTDNEQETVVDVVEEETADYNVAEISETTEDTDGADDQDYVTVEFEVCNDDDNEEEDELDCENVVVTDDVEYELETDPNSSLYNEEYAKSVKSYENNADLDPNDAIAVESNVIDEDINIPGVVIGPDEEYDDQEEDDSSTFEVDINSDNEIVAYDSARDDMKSARLVRPSDSDVIFSTDETVNYIRAQYYDEDCDDKYRRKNRNKKKSYSKKYHKKHKPFHNDDSDMSEY